MCKGLNKLNTDHRAGYVGKMVAGNVVSYTWIQTNWF